MAAASALVQGVGLRFVAPRLGERMAVAISTIAFAAASVLYHFADSRPAVYLAIVVGSLHGFVAPSIQALNSKAVDARSQGELQGATQSVGSLAMIVAPPLYSLMFARFDGSGVAQIPATPLMLAGGFALMALALFLGGRSVHANSKRPWLRPLQLWAQFLHFRATAQNFKSATTS